MIVIEKINIECIIGQAVVSQLRLFFLTFPK